MKQADDGDEHAAIDGLVSSWAENISAILLDSYYRHYTDESVMCPGSIDSRTGRNTIIKSLSYSYTATVWPLATNPGDATVPDALWLLIESALKHLLNYLFTY